MKTLTAPMGWNSWDCYGIIVSEEQVRQNAQFMAKHLKKYGWEYVVLDGQWYGTQADGHHYINFADVNMDEYSRLIPSPALFPSSVGGNGFKPLADYIHSLGLKFGIRILRGIPRQAVQQNTAIKKTDKKPSDIVRISSICTWNTDMYGVSPFTRGSREYYESVFELYASWGVDFIKLDDMNDRLDTCEDELLLITDCMKNCGRDMTLSLAPGCPSMDKVEMLKENVNSWRVRFNFWDRWDFLYDTLIQAAKWSSHIGAGHWVDADILAVGPILQDYDIENYTAFNEDEQYTMLTLWSIIRSPLWIGGEMIRFDEFTMNLLTNENILRMHTDARHSHQMWRREIGDIEHILWEASDINGGTFIALFNVGQKDSTVTLSTAELEIPDKGTATDLWTNEQFDINEQITFKPHKHGVKVYHIKHQY